jgi:hypothetical protein
MESAHPWARVAQALGLVYDGCRIAGPLGGHNVEAFGKTFPRYGADVPHTVVTSSLGWPLDLGLSVTPQRQRGLNQFLGLPETDAEPLLGDPSFDKAFAVAADEPHRAAVALMPPLRQALWAFHSEGPDAFGLHDGGFWIAQPGLVVGERWLAHALRSASDVVALLGAARAVVPVATALTAHHDAWQAFARRTGLTATTVPLGVRGVYEGARVRAHIVRVARLKYRVKVGVEFGGNLGLGLLVHRRAAPAAFPWTANDEDVSLGDPAFDEVFAARCARPDLAAMIIDADVRAALVQLNTRVGPPLLHDTALAIRTSGLSYDPTDVPRLVDHLRKIAERIESNARRVVADAIVQHRPYR